MANKRFAKSRFGNGSALILTVVLTSLLAIIGVLFVMVSRLDKMATSAISENRDLDLAVETVIARVSQKLVLDVPGAAGQEYYDYPDVNDIWLACLEPYESGGKYYWQQISNITGRGGAKWRDLKVEIIDDYQPNIVEDVNADTDGDGVADSVWVLVPDMTSSKGKPIYAAVRIVDNGGMINVNTAFRSPQGTIGTPGDPDPNWDGSMLSHVNLCGIISVTDSVDANTDANTVQRARYGAVLMPPIDYYRNDIQYEYDVARRLHNPVLGYLPFDIGDELELRNRFFLFSPVLTRISQVWPVTFNPGPGTVGKKIPYVPGDDISDWYDKATGPEPPKNICNRRHLSTTYSFDRVLMPEVDSQVINSMPSELQTAWNNWMSGVGRDRAQVCIADVLNGSQQIELLAAAVWLGLPGVTATPPAYGFNLVLGDYSWPPLTRTDLACQIAVNLIDYIDIDPNISKVSVTVGGVTRTYFGYEQKSVYISEIAVAKYNDGVNPVVTYYALELYNPDPVNVVDLANWKLVIGGVPLNISGFTVPAAGTLIIVNDAAAAGPTRFGVTASVLSGLVFQDDDHLTLLDTSGRPVDAIYTGTVSGIPAPPGFSAYNITRGDWFIGNSVPIWDTSKKSWVSGHGLGSFVPDEGTFLEKRAHIQVNNRNDGKLPTVGEIFLTLGIGASSYSDVNGITYQSLPEWFNAYRSGTDLIEITAGRMDTTHRDFASLLDFITQFHPFSDSVDNDGNGKSDNPGADGVDNDGDTYIDEPNEGVAAYTEFSELAVAGRVNINTAPWFVIAQLPWMQYEDNIPFERAQAVVDYRDKLGIYAGRLGKPGFTTTVELMQVATMQNLVSDGLDNLNKSDPNGPDFTYDTVRDDLEERDLIFSRISNLVTVRSDVFTAYILVRIGTDGPQKRVIAILDRSNVYSSDDKVRIVALHPVPDPR